MTAQSLVETILPPDKSGLTARSLRRFWEGRSSQTKKLGTYGGGITSKMWMLPDGQFVALDRWHWDWLQAHPDVAKKYGVNLQVDDIDGRLNALRRGFFRVNYERNRGSLTIEGLAKFWTKAVKDSVFMLVVDNVDAIDNMTVTLMNDSGGIVRNGSAQLFRLSAEEKLDHLPLISESRRGRALRALVPKLMR